MSKARRALKLERRRRMAALREGRSRPPSDATFCTRCYRKFDPEAVQEYMCESCGERTISIGRRMGKPRPADPGPAAPVRRFSREASAGLPTLGKRP